MRRREIRDPVHGFIHRRDAEEKIIDTRIFQRLRRIKQLAMANLVYPGATHTRFDHSIGVMHVAGLMGKIIRLDDHENDIVRLAALVHDIGHGPFSHVSENVLEIFSPKEEIGQEGRYTVHEVITRKIIASNKQLLRILGEDRAEQIVSILDGRADRLLREVVSGPLDADKQDYLLRDSLFCGVKYGIFDIGRLHNTLIPYEDKEGRFLGIDGPDGIHSLEQYILAKYYMMTQVYMHKVRLLTDAMITRGLELGIEQDKLTAFRDIYSYRDSEEYIEEYVKWDDEKLIAEVIGGKESCANKMFRRLINRRLYKRVFHAKIASLKEHVREAISNISRPEFREKRNALEQRIAEAIDVQEEPVIASSYTIASVREHTPLSEGSIIVVSEGDKRPFEQESALFTSIRPAMLDKYFDVYAPVTYADESDKKRKKKEFEEKINAIILDFFKEEVNDESQPMGHSIGDNS